MAKKEKQAEEQVEKTVEKKPEIVIPNKAGDRVPLAGFGHDDGGLCEVKSAISSGKTSQAKPLKVRVHAHGSSVVVFEKEMVDGVYPEGEMIVMCTHRNPELGVARMVTGADGMVMFSTDRISNSYIHNGADYHFEIVSSCKFRVFGVHI